MHRAGQFLVEPISFLGWFNLLGVIAVGVMLFTLFKLRANYLLRLSPDITPEKFSVGLGVGGTLSIISTLLLTTISLMFFGTVVELTGKDVNQDRARLAGLDQERHPSTRSNTALVYVGARSLVDASENRMGRVAIVAGVLLLAVGAGYAFTLLKLGFWGSFAAMSAGIALPEELAKAAAGLLVLYLIFDTKSLSEAQFRRAVLAAFAIAGLGFGAGEALKYFGAYAREDAGAFWYGVRAVWCVTLHGSWTLIVGAYLTSSLPQDPKRLENKKTETFYALLLASIPSVIAHGLYNACCCWDQRNGEALPWIVGGLSLFVAFGVVEVFLAEQQEEPKVEQQPS